MASADTPRRKLLQAKLDALKGVKDCDSISCRAGAEHAEAEALQRLAETMEAKGADVREIRAVLWRATKLKPGIFGIQKKMEELTDQAAALNKKEADERPQINGKTIKFHNY
eukprot:SAG31_NODE_34296_length_334_cov_1.102128_1_plen_111_part_11